MFRLFCRRVRKGTQKLAGRFTPTERGFIMSASEYLKDHNVKFKVMDHHPVFSAVELANQEHVDSLKVAKPVLIKADGIFYMCVLPACFKIDFDVLKEALHVNKVLLASESEMVVFFSDCQLGAEPPFGNLYGLPTLMDRSLELDRDILFAAGTHDKAIRMKMKDFVRLVNPHIISFIAQHEMDECDMMLYDPYYYDSFVYNPFYPM
jgi:Ala-tRNA(Pro) deacylase